MSELWIVGRQGAVVAVGRRELRGVRPSLRQGVRATRRTCLSLSVEYQSGHRTREAMQQRVGISVELGGGGRALWLGKAAKFRRGKYIGG